MEIFSDKLGTELDTIGPIEYMNFVKRYRVEHQTLPVEFFFNFYRILEDMNMKIGTDDPLVLTYDIIKG